VERYPEHTIVVDETGDVGTDPHKAPVLEMRRADRPRRRALAEALGMSERTVRAVPARNGFSRLPRLDPTEPAQPYESASR
jgi:hypothetical protein